MKAEGSSAISGYTASSVAYGLNASNPSNIDSVSFTLSPAAAATVKIQLVSGGSWYDCSNSGGSVSCGTTSPLATVSAANTLTVLAVQLAAKRQRPGGARLMPARHPADVSL